MVLFASGYEDFFTGVRRGWLLSWIIMPLFYWLRSINFFKGFFCGEDSIKNGQVLRERKIHLNFEVIWLFLQQKLTSRKALKCGVHCMTRTRISVSIQDSISVYDTQEVSTFKLWKYLWDKIFNVSSRKLLFWFLAVTFIDGREGGGIFVVTWKFTRYPHVRLSPSHSYNSYDSPLLWGLCTNTNIKNLYR